MSVIEDTLIITNIGRITASVIYQNPTDYQLLTFDDQSNLFGWGEIIHAEESNVSTYLQLNFASGNSLSCTLDHKLYKMNSGLVQVSSLVSLDFLVALTRFDLLNYTNVIEANKAVYRFTLLNNNKYFANTLISSDQE